jgi:hypothetical protein
MAGACNPGHLNKITELFSNKPSLLPWLRLWDVSSSISASFLSEMDNWSRRMDPEAIS